MRAAIMAETWIQALLQESQFKDFIENPPAISYGDNADTAIIRGKFYSLWVPTICQSIDF